MTLIWSLAVSFGTRISWKRVWEETGACSQTCGKANFCHPRSLTNMLDSKGFPNDGHFLIIYENGNCSLTGYSAAVSACQKSGQWAGALAYLDIPACQTGVHQGNHLLGGSRDPL